MIIQINLVIVQINLVIIQINLVIDQNKLVIIKIHSFHQYLAICDYLFTIWTIFDNFIVMFAT